jgi:gag-polyprotein putative aspartyl protease
MTNYPEVDNQDMNNMDEPLQDSSKRRQRDANTRTWREPQMYDADADEDISRTSMHRHPEAIPMTRQDIVELIEQIAQLRPQARNIIIPSSDQAPKFRGNNLRSFLGDYNIAAESAGWNDAEKCEKLPLYCSRETRNLVRRLEARQRGNWRGTEAALREFYGSEEQRDRYSREQLDRFVRKIRSIKSKKEFIKYYREFANRLNGLKNTITMDERDRLFWIGLPKKLQKDVYVELIAEKPGLDRQKAASIEDVHRIALRALDRHSIYAHLTASRKKKEKSKAVTRKSDKKKAKKNKKDTDESSDSSSSESEDSARERKRSFFKTTDESSSEDSESDSSSNESDTESSESDDDDYDKRQSKRKSHKKRTSKESKYKSTKSKLNRDRLKGDSSKNDVTDLSEQFRELKIMLTKGIDKKVNDEEEDIPRMLKTSEPTNKELAKMVSHITREVEANQNDLKLLLDRNRPGSFQGRTFSRCFMCQKTDTHPRGTFNCPEAQAVVQEGLCLFQMGKIYMADGSAFPEVNEGESRAMAIRNRYKGRRMGNTGNKATGKSPQVSYARIFEPSEEESERYETGYEDTGTGAALWKHVFAADRTEKPDHRMNPMTTEKRFEHKGKQPEQRASVPRPIPFVEVPAVPRDWDRNKRKFEETAKLPVPKPEDKRPRYDDSAPPRILKTIPNGARKDYQGKGPERKQEEYKFKDQPNIRKTDFVVRGDARAPNPGPAKIIRNPVKNRFVTTIRQRYAKEDIYKKVLESDVKLQLGELLAVCPEIERDLSKDTKLHVVPVTQVNAGNQDEEMAEAFAGLKHEKRYTEFETQEEIYESKYAENSEEEPGVYTSNRSKEMLALRRNRKYPSNVMSPTAVFEVQIGETNIMAMADSGAEMNMITPWLAEKLRGHYAEDESGMKYSVRDVSGAVNNLQGKFNNIPVTIGGTPFYQTFFVGQEWGSAFDMILGQTFLGQYACEMVWTDSENQNRVSLRLHPSGKRMKEGIKVRLHKNYGSDRDVGSNKVSVARLYQMNKPYGETSDSDSDSNPLKLSNTQDEYQQERFIKRRRNKSNTGKERRSKMYTTSTDSEEGEKVYSDNSNDAEGSEDSEYGIKRSKKRFRKTEVTTSKDDRDDEQQRDKAISDQQARIEKGINNLESQSEDWIESANERNKGKEVMERYDTPEEGYTSERSQTSIDEHRATDDKGKKSLKKNESQANTREDNQEELTCESQQWHSWKGADECLRIDRNAFSEPMIKAVPTGICLINDNATTTDYNKDADRPWSELGDYYDENWTVNEYSNPGIVRDSENEPHEVEPGGSQQQAHTNVEPTLGGPIARAL